MAREGHEVTREYVDELESGRTADRPQFQRMIADARRQDKPFDAILVWKFSRFARSRKDAIVYKSLLKKYGVRVISITGPSDDTPTGKLMEGIIESLDEFYSANLADDVLRGMTEAASRGFMVGSGTPYGYRRVKVLDGEEGETQTEAGFRNGSRGAADIQVGSEGSWCKGDSPPTQRGRRRGPQRETVE